VPSETDVGECGESVQLKFEFSKSGGQKGFVLAGVNSSNIFFSTAGGVYTLPGVMTVSGVSRSDMPDAECPIVRGNSDCVVNIG